MLPKHSLSQRIRSILDCPRFCQFLGVSRVFETNNRQSEVLGWHACYESRPTSNSFGEPPPPWPAPASRSTSATPWGAVTGKPSFVAAGDTAADARAAIGIDLT